MPRGSWRFRARDILTLTLLLIVVCRHVSCMQVCCRNSSVAAEARDTSSREQNAKIITQRASPVSGGSFSHPSAPEKKTVIGRA